MSDFIDDLLVSGVKRALDEKRMSVKQLSSLTEIPYRTLQKYTSGETKMPASALVRICDVLDVDLYYLVHGEFDLNHIALWDALWDVLGDGLLEIKYVPCDPDLSDMPRHQQKQQAASEMAAKIRASYEKYRQTDLNSKYHTGRGQYGLLWGKIDVR